MEGNIFYKTTENVLLKKDISQEEIIEFLKHVQNEIHYRIFDVLNDIKANKFKTFSITREEPKMSLFVFGGLTHISVKIEKNEKEAEISIPRISEFEQMK